LFRYWIKLEERKKRFTRISDGNFSPGGAIGHSPRWRGMLCVNSGCPACAPTTHVSGTQGQAMLFQPHRSCSRRGRVKTATLTLFWTWFLVNIATGECVGVCWNLSMNTFRGWGTCFTALSVFILSHTRADYLHYNDVDSDWYWDLFAQIMTTQITITGNSLALAASWIILVNSFWTVFCLGAPASDLRLRLPRESYCLGSPSFDLFPPDPSDRLTLEACFSPTQEEAHITAYDCWLRIPRN
jgi:hypothetical protein